ncbi:hypothetical protein DIPPA_30548 [Diplonema papillatum]|nr:hypothetical protein DIPPA_30552 [Diplonema papillatum]KAJ9451138.1 hypothetical protein DIPPA_30548 [Diplonema papillatum]
MAEPCRPPEVTLGVVRDRQPSSATLSGTIITGFLRYFDGSGGGGSDGEKSGGAEPDENPCWTLRSFTSTVGGLPQTRKQPTAPPPGAPKDPAPPTLRRGVTGPNKSRVSENSKPGYPQ